MLRVYSLEELFDAAETLANYATAGSSASPTGNGAGARLAIVTNGGGLGVLATDPPIDEGGSLAALAPETVTAPDASRPPPRSHPNPDDLVGPAPGAPNNA